MEGHDQWKESDSAAFLAYGSFFVPGRAEQLRIMLTILSAQRSLAAVVELCCGEGHWSQAILRRFPQCRLLAMDGSPMMLRHTADRLAGLADRLEVRRFDLADGAWRNLQQVDAFVSSLAVHHLGGGAKQLLFSDLYRMLAPGGVLLIADLVMPTREVGRAVAGVAWDEAVKQQLAGKPEAEEVFRFFKEDGWNFYDDPQADPVDQPSGLLEQLQWLTAAGFTGVDVFWMQAGHVVFGGWKSR